MMTCIMKGIKGMPNFLLAPKKLAAVLSCMFARDKTTIKLAL